MYSPIENHVVIYGQGSNYQCCVPHCGRWVAADDRDHRLCDFHLKLASRQSGEPFRWPEPEDPDAAETAAERMARHAAYAVHRDRELQRIPYHLMMASLWPGPHAESKAKDAKRQKTLKQRWQEEGDRDD